MPAAAVVYLRMSPALHDALKEHAAQSGTSLNAYAVQALAAAAGPDFLRDVRAGGAPATVNDQERVLVRPERMAPIVDRLGRDATSRVIANSKDHDRVWAWYVGREAELATLAATRTP
jgi:uncharacterized protein (DUF1778 family)